MSAWRARAGSSPRLTVLSPRAIFRRLPRRFPATSDLRFSFFLFLSPSSTHVDVHFLPYSLSLFPSSLFFSVTARGGRRLLRPPPRSLPPPNAFFPHPLSSYTSRGVVCLPFPFFLFSGRESGELEVPPMAISSTLVLLLFWASHAAIGFPLCSKKGQNVCIYSFHIFFFPFLLKRVYDISCLSGEDFGLLPKHSSTI